MHEFVQSPSLSQANRSEGDALALACADTVAADVAVDADVVTVADAEGAAELELAALVGWSAEPDEPQPARTKAPATQHRIIARPWRSA